MHKLLVIDDEPWVRELMYELLKDEYYVKLAENGKQGWKMLQEELFAVVLLDLRMPDLSGMDVLKLLRGEQISSVPIVITANKDLESAVNAMKLGAYDYIVKPFDNEKLRITIKNAIDKIVLEKEVRNLREVVEKTYKFDNIISVSPQMNNVVQVIHRVLDNDTTLLITGDSGTGKEVVARTIHYNSPRKNMPFVALDCAAIPDTLIENEFFGHEKGAFTGALTRSQGKFELANNGTLFLDEIGNLRLDVQAKLLRVLQEREFTRIGGTEKIHINVRIICATNANLEQAIQEGKFREDLYYRINVVPIQLPPLRERQGDIAILLEYFLEKFNHQLGKNIVISEEAMRILLAYRWPGNVRELENLVNRMVVMKKNGAILPDDLPLDIFENDAKSGGVLPSNVTLAQLEERYIRKVLDEQGYNISRSAKLLGITRKTLHNKLNRMDLGPQVTTQN